MYVSLYNVCTYVYMHMLPPLLSTHLGLVIRIFGLENLGLGMCMDESLGHRYLSLAASHGFGLADSNPLIAIVSQKNQPVSQGQQSWPWLQSESEMRAIVLSSARVIAPAKVKVRGLVMAIVIVQPLENVRK